MKNIKYLFILLPLSIFLTSCDPEEYFTPVVEIELPKHIPKLVVYSQMFEGQDSINVFVTKSRGALDNTPFPKIKDSIRYTINKDTFWHVNTWDGSDTVNNVTVEFYKNDLLVTKLKQSGNKVVFGAKLPTALKADGSTYRLKVSAPNFETVEATQKMPTPAAIDTIVYKQDVRVTDPRDPLNYLTTDEFAITFQDPAGEKNYYTAEGVFKTSNSNDTLFLYLRSYDPISTENYVSDETFNGKKATWKQHGYLYNRGAENKVQLYLLSVSEDFYLYRLSLNRFYNAQDNPFAEPSILYTNIKNGYGIFAMGSYRAFSFTVK